MTNAADVFAAVLAALKTVPGATVFSQYEPIPDDATLPVVALQLTADGPNGKAPGTMVKKTVRLAIHLQCVATPIPTELLNLADTVRKALRVAERPTPFGSNTSIGELQVLPPDDGSAIAAGVLSMSVEYVQSYA